MNFPGMPEFQWKYGYLAVIGVSVLLIIIEIVYFKKKADLDIFERRNIMSASESTYLHD